MVAHRSPHESSRAKDRRKVVYIESPELENKLRLLLEKEPKMRSVSGVINAALAYFLPLALKNGVDSHFQPNIRLKPHASQ